MHFIFKLVIGNRMAKKSEIKFREIEKDQKPKESK